MKKKWRLLQAIGEYNSESEALEARESLCGINHRDDYLIVEMSWLELYEELNRAKAHFPSGSGDE